MVIKTSRILLDVVNLVLLLVLLYISFNQLTKCGCDYMMVSKVHVPDHQQGTDARLFYDRTIIRNFYGRWNAKVYLAGTSETVCSNVGEHYYEQVDKISWVTLSWFLERECDLPEGRYFIKAVWVVDRGPTIRKSSNVFTVRRGDNG